MFLEISTCSTSNSIWWYFVLIIEIFIFAIELMFPEWEHLLNILIQFYFETRTFFASKLHAQKVVDDIQDIRQKIARILFCLEFLPFEMNCLETYARIGRLKTPGETVVSFLEVKTPDSHWFWTVVRKR